MPLLSTLRTLQLFRNSKSLLTSKLNYQHNIRRCFKYRVKSENGKVELTTKLKNERPSEYKLSSLFKCYLFTGSFCGALFIGTSVWHYENLGNKFKYSSQYIYQSLSDRVHKEGKIRMQLNIWWNTLSEEQKVFYFIFCMNLLVFGCWKVPIFNGFMQKYFLCSPVAKALCWPMVFSTFSHYSLLHFGMNMYVLNSFCDKTCEVLGKEQFIGFYLGAGVVSSLASQTFKFICMAPNRSLGASGAILALLGFFCSHHPSAQVNIIFLPQFSFSAENAIKGIMCLDFAGILLRWKLMDHAAHLGGALFGIFYYHFGESLVWCHRNIVIDQWKAIKGKLKRN